MKKPLLFCMILLAFTLAIKAQKIEIEIQNEAIFLVDKSGKSPKSVQYSSLFHCSYFPDIVIAERDKYFLVNLATANSIELAEEMENLRIEGDSCIQGVQDYLRFRSKKKIGLLNFPYKIILPAEYDEIIPQADKRTFFIVKKGKNCQFYYPQTNKFSNSFQMANSTNLNLDNGLCYLPDKEVFFVTAGGVPCVMKTDGTQYMLDKYYSKGIDLNYDGVTFIPCKQNGKYGFIDAYANIVIPFIYDEANLMDNIAIVKYKGKYGLINEAGNELIPCAYDKLETDKVAFMKGTKEGKVVLFNEGGYLMDQLMILEKDNKYGFANEAEKVIIACEYESAINFDIGTAAVKKGGKWGYILPTGHKLIDFQFEDAKSFQHYGLAAVKSNGKWGFIDYEGKFVIEPTYDSIKIIEDFYYHLFKDGTCYMLDSDRKIRFIYLIPVKASFTDQRNGKSYQSVKIGSQTWMAQNLNYKTEESWYFENNAENGVSHGLLYSWKAALTACPTGWHLPSDKDWQILEKTLGIPDEELNSTDYRRGSDQAIMFRPGGISCFDVQMSGFLHGYDNNFYKLDDVCIIWTSTPAQEGFAYSRSFFPDTDMINRSDNTYVKYALPVRCVKD